MLHLHGDGSDGHGCHSDGVKSNYQINDLRENLKVELYFNYIGNQMSLFCIQNFDYL